jgi:hypothetical protein
MSREGTGVYVSFVVYANSDGMAHGFGSALNTTYYYDIDTRTCEDADRASSTMFPRRAHPIWQKGEIKVYQRAVDLRSDDSGSPQVLDIPSPKGPSPSFDEYTQWCDSLREKLVTEGYSIQKPSAWEGVIRDLRLVRSAKRACLGGSTSVSQATQDAIVERIRMLLRDEFS